MISQNSVRLSDATLRCSDPSRIFIRISSLFGPCRAMSITPRSRFKSRKVTRGPISRDGMPLSIR